jgi:cysteine desulfurase/selenocysteine lyase
MNNNNFFDVESIRQDFPALKQEIHAHPLVYLDSAATAQKPQVVIDAMRAYYEEFPANIHRGAYFLSEVATKKFHEARHIISNFVGASPQGQIIFTRSCTESINLVAHGLSKILFNEGDEIILTQMEHHANIVPWWLLAQERKLVLKIARVLDNGEVDLEHFASLFNNKTRLAAFSHASNAVGTINPIKTMLSIAKKFGVATLIDGAQAVHHVPLNLSDLDVDFYAFSGHKTYGPTGIGVLYMKNSWFDTMPVYQGGGDMISSVSFDHITFAQGPQKFEAGTPHIAGALGLGAAFNYLSKLGLDNIHRYEKLLHTYALNKLSRISRVKIIGEAQERVSLISFTLPGVHPHDLSSIFDRQGIAIRAGHLCAEPLVRRFGQSAFARVSLAFYNTTAEIDRFIGAFERVFEVFKL